MAALPPDQIDRYARHIVLPEIGGAGQVALSQAHILVIGAGGIGCPALAYLAAAGIGTITVLDDDTVDASNLQRQILFGDADIGTPKVQAAAKSLRAQNPDCHIVPLEQRFTAQYAASSSLPDISLILDGSDSFSTRRAANKWALKHSVPLIAAAVGPFEIQLGSYYGWRANAPCYECLVGKAQDAAEDTCAATGILGAVTGIAGSLAALEAIRAIRPFGADRAGRLSLFDLKTMRWRDLALTKDPACAACGSGSAS